MCTWETLLRRSPTCGTQLYLEVWWPAILGEKPTCANLAQRVHTTSLWQDRSSCQSNVCLTSSVHSVLSCKVVTCAPVLPREPDRPRCSSPAPAQAVELQRNEPRNSSSEPCGHVLGVRPCSTVVLAIHLARRTTGSSTNTFVDDLPRLLLRRQLVVELDLELVER